MLGKCKRSWKRVVVYMCRMVSLVSDQFANVAFERML